MSVLDRYILRQLVINYLVLFATFVLLMTSVDCIANFDEFLNVARDAEGFEAAWKVTATIVSFYAPKTILFYVYLAGILPVAAAGFTLAQMVRANELIALNAGGVNALRVAAPIIAFGVLSSTSVLIVQELAIPELREQIAIPHRYVKYGGIPPRPIEFVPDRDLDTVSVAPLYSAQKFDLTQRRLENLKILFRDDLGRESQRVTAKLATWDADRAGWHLTGGLSVRQSADGRGRLQGDAEPIEFVDSRLDPSTLAVYEMNEFRTMLSTPEMVDLLGRDTIIPPSKLMLILHGRYSAAVVNVLILVMGMGFFLKKLPNLFKQSLKCASICLPLWVGSLLMTQASPPDLGWTLMPVVIAWLPALAYLPVALFMLDRVES